MKILVKGWINVPHSYACVNCFQLVHLYKNYGDKIDIYVEEMEYYRPEWNNVKKLVYTDEYNEILQNLKVWKGEPVDLVYSIVYPYNISPHADTRIPKCVFYTSEFATLNQSYFVLDNKIGFATEQDVINHIKQYDNLYFTSPSLWSSHGLEKFSISSEKNRIITHGVDTSIIKKYTTNDKRKQIRKFYKVKDDDYLLLNIGAMTKNKGIIEILISFNHVVNKLNKKNYKLLLKGTGDLYQSRQFLELYFEEIEKHNVITKDEKQNLLDNHIIFTDKTFTYNRLNDLYNAADIYISPYLAEGFGLVPLESLACGLKVIIPRTGSTKEYIQDIYDNGGHDLIHYVDSSITEFENGFKQNSININHIVDVLLKSETNKQKGEDYVKMREYIEENYSWNKVSELLYNYFKFILKEKM